MEYRVNPPAETTEPVSAIVTAYRRIDQTIDTVRRIKACRPAPDEIIVHVDANQTECVDAIRREFPDIELLVSSEAVGPGGGRNKLMAAARNEVVTSFDDDSYPMDIDFFARAGLLMNRFPEASLIAGAIFDRGEPVAADELTTACTASFGSGGTVFRRTPFLAAGGFVPLVVAYGMEEEDLALRLLDRGQTLLRSPWLRVFHDSDLSHHNSARITSAVIANLALLTWLRYPASYWPYGALQVANRILWCLRVGRHSGILKGIGSIPRHLAKHWGLRRPVSKAAMRQRFAARASALRPFVRADDGSLAQCLRPPAQIR
jgi:GT2 family glycosyltransferase